MLGRAPINEPCWPARGSQPSALPSLPERPKTIPKKSPMLTVRRSHRSCGRFSSVDAVIAPDSARAGLDANTVERKAVAVKLAIRAICRCLIIRVGRSSRQTYAGKAFMLSQKAHHSLRAYLPANLPENQNQSIVDYRVRRGSGSNLSEGRRTTGVISQVIDSA